MGNCYRKGQPFNPGEILDRVVANAEPECLLYNLANFKKGGQLIEAFNKGGSTGVEVFIREKLGFMMYNNGKGEVITKTEYLRWKFRNNQKGKIHIGDNDKMSPHDPLGYWEDHAACWRMQYRGSLGESLLHILIICDTLIHTRIARLLLKCFPRSAWDMIEGQEYLGATGLHLAIAYNNDELAQCIIENGVNIHIRARGTFFLPADQQHDTPLKVTDYSGLAYLGEYALAWSCCMSNEGVYNLLVLGGADPNSMDRFGNTVLHMVVVSNQMGMFGYTLRHPIKPGNQYLENYAGLTCLTLSCKLGRDDLFMDMLELSCKEFWRYSNICCSAYPLGALDSIFPDGSTNWGSAMMIILAGTKEEHLNMLEGGIIAKLLEEKWTTFASMFFIKRLVITIIHLVCISIAIYFRPDKDTTLLHGVTDGDITTGDIIRYCFELSTILGCLAYLIVQQGEEIKNSGVTSFYRNLKGTPPKLIFVVCNFLFLACVPVRFMMYMEPNEEDYYRGLEEAFLVFAVPGSWFYLVFFCGAIKLTGPFVVMIYAMIMGDMYTFSIIYIIFLFGFTQAFFYLIKSTEDPGLYEGYHLTWVGLFHMTLGEYDYATFNDTPYPGMAKIIFVIFQIFIPILLFNMLIAMMGNTYASVNEKSEKEFLKMWAKIIMSFERSVPQNQAKEYLEKYSIRLTATERGVMVIKAKDKTRASQRKGALSNWKKTGKTVIKYLKKRKMTGDDLRREMWVHDEAATPKAKKGKKKAKGYDVSTLTGQTDDQNKKEPGDDLGQPAYIGGDPHCMGKRRPKKSREDKQRELFLQKRSRKGLNKGPTVSNMADFDFNLGTIESESDSSSDETYLVPTSKDVAKSMRNAGIANGGFIGDNGYAVVNEKASPESRVCPREPRDFEKEDKEIADDLTGAANGHARLIPEEDAEVAAELTKQPPAEPEEKKSEE